MNASLITKITSWLEFLGKNLHLVGCATVCGKSEVMLTIGDPMADAVYACMAHHIPNDSKMLAGLQG